MEDERLIKKEHGEQLMKDYNFELFMETSAKTGLNTEELFVKAAKILYKDYLSYINQENSGQNQIKKPLKHNNEVVRNKDKGCC